MRFEQLGQPPKKNDSIQKAEPALNEAWRRFPVPSMEYVLYSRNRYYGEGPDAFVFVLGFQKESNISRLAVYKLRVSMLGTVIFWWATVGARVMTNIMVPYQWYGYSTRCLKHTSK